MQDGLGNKIVYTLDAMGDRVKEQAFDPGGQLARVRQQVFDSLNRLHQSVGAQSEAAMVVRLRSVALAGALLVEILAVVLLLPRLELAGHQYMRGRDDYEEGGLKVSFTDLVAI